MKTLLWLAKRLFLVAVVIGLVLLGIRLYLAKQDTASSDESPKVLCITIDLPTISLPPGGSQNLTATGNFSNGAKQDFTKRVTWASSDPKIAEIGADGRVKAIGEGRAQITVTLEHQGASSSVFVGKPELIGLAINPSNISSGPNQSVAYRAVGTFSDGSSRDMTNSVNWTSSMPDTASISDGGIASTKKVGTVATIIVRAASGPISTSTFLTVTPNPGGFTGVLTYHNDVMRTGENRNETILSPSNVNPSSFGEQFSIPVDGNIYAQPLYAANVAIPGKGLRNVVFVATENNTLYAFDAENPAGEVLWQVNLGPAVPYEVQPPGNCTGIEPTIGITSTPVIDAASNTIYVMARTYEAPATFKHALHALDLATGKEREGSPAIVAANVKGKGTGSKKGRLAFDPSLQLQRAGLLLADGRVYAAFASNCDYGDYHGWIFAYNAKNLTQEALFVTTPNGESGGVWQAGGGLASAPDGKVYMSVGDGSFDPTANGQDYGDTFLKLGLTNEGLNPVDYFAPYNQDRLDRVNLDLGSGGIVALPDQAGAHPHLVIGAGKEGTVYVVDRDDMKHKGEASDAQIVQSLTSAMNPVFSTPAIWQDSKRLWIYYNSVNFTVRAYSMENGVLSPTPVSQSVERFGSPGATPSVSSDGEKNAIVWVLGRGVSQRKSGARDYLARLYSTVIHPKALGAFVTRMFKILIHPSSWRDILTRKLPGGRGGEDQPAVLLAFDARDLSVLLFNSAQAQGKPGSTHRSVKFAVPTVANGRVYCGTKDHLDVYGLLH
jgi:hypothetical protein